LVIVGDRFEPRVGCAGIVGVADDDVFGRKVLEQRF
jgi:hypothetical protein